MIANVVTLSVGSFVTIIVAAIVVSSVVGYLLFDRLLTELKANQKLPPAEHRISSMIAPFPLQPVRAQKKLFLSWAAVYCETHRGWPEEGQLDRCLFCTSAAEQNLAEDFDAQAFERLHPHFIKAAREGRLICNMDLTRLNATTLNEVNALLEKNGEPKLSCYPDGTLDRIPMYMAVPYVPSETIEAVWATHPLPADWRRCWGRSLEEINAAFDQEGADDDDSPAPHANWMDELNRPLIEEARRKFESPSGDQDSSPEFGTSMQEEEDPADAWKKGRPQDEQ
jgi:hypothetical protein